MKYPAAHSMNIVDTLLKHIQTIPPPAHFDDAARRASGFTGNNASDSRALARSLGFTDALDVPTDRWSEYQRDPAVTLAAAVRETYADLFAYLPDAAAMPDQMLASWFAPPVTSRSVTSRQRAIRTFRHLCELAGMDTDRHPAIDRPFAEPAPPGHLPIVFALPPGASPADYQAIFRAAKSVFTGTDDTNGHDRRGTPTT